LVLHFSGHGLKNCKEDVGAESIIHENEGDMLLFENDNLSGVLVTELKLKEILKGCKTKIHVAVVLSCHSEYIGNIFFNAGIDHVI
jgi:hypothetical protein